MFNYLDLLLQCEEYNDFWMRPMIIQNAYQKNFVIEYVIKERDKIEKHIKELEDAGRSISGIRREKYKELFKEFKFFLIEVYKYWLKDPVNEKHVKEFIKDFATMFNKLRALAGISNDLILPNALHGFSKEPVSIG